MTLVLVCLFLIGNADELSRLYNRGAYDSLIVKADSMLGDSTLIDRIEIMKFKAYALVARGDLIRAKLLFGEILNRDPLVTLNPREVSPKILNIFEEVKRSHVWVVPERVRVETLLVKPSKRTLTMSFVYPGLGQFAAKRKVSGLALLALETAALSGLALSSFYYKKEYDQYLDETDPAVIPQRYADANTWYRTRMGFGCGALLLYFFGIFDASIHL